MSTGNFLNSGAESDPIALTAKVMGGDGMAKSCKMKGAIFTLDHFITCGRRRVMSSLALQQTQGMFHSPKYGSEGLPFSLYSA